MFQSIVQKVKDLYAKLADPGVKLPFLFDAVSKQPSITILFAYVTFWLAVGSAIAAHFKLALLPVTIVCIFFWIVATVLYLMRKLHKAKIDLQNKSLDLDSGDDDPKQP